MPISTPKTDSFLGQSLISDLDNSYTRPSLGLADGTKTRLESALCDEPGEGVPAAAASALRTGKSIGLIFDHAPLSATVGDETPKTLGGRHVAPKSWRNTPAMIPEMIEANPMSVRSLVTPRAIRSAPQISFRG